MIHLTKINLHAAATGEDVFPFNLPLVRATRELAFHRPVTFLVGENGTGKSTLLEAMAAGINAVTIGGDDVRTDPTLIHARRLADRLKFAWRQRTHRGFFLRAEDFFQFTRRVRNLMRDLDGIKQSYQGRPDSYGLRLARGAIEGQKAGLVRKYGEDPDAQSHGESFFKLFQAQLVPGGLYLLDEPETPFSPKRQLALMVLIHEHDRPRLPVHHRDPFAGTDGLSRRRDPEFRRTARAGGELRRPGTRPACAVIFEPSGKGVETPVE